MKRRIPAHAGRAEHPLESCGDYLASCLEAGLFLAALSGWDTVRTAYYEYSNPMGLEGLLMQYPLSWCFRIGLVLVCAVLAFLGWEGSSRVSLPCGDCQWGTGPSPCCGPATAFLPVVLLGGPPGHPAGSPAPPPSPVWHRSSPAPRLCSWPATATPISTACCPWTTVSSVRNLSMRRPGDGGGQLLPSSGAWAAGPSPFCPWRRSPPSAFPCPWAPLNSAGRRSSSAPISTTAFSTPRTVCPLSWGPSCFCQPVRPGRLPCQILRRDPYEE